MQGKHVRFCQIGDMHVVANAGAIRGFVVISEDRQMRNPASGRLEGSRYQVRFRIVPFAQFAVRVGAASVEIAQRHIAQPVGRRVVAEHVFRDELCSSIGIDGLLRRPLLNRENRGHAVGRATR
jgi:hypothetical protein